MQRWGSRGENVYCISVDFSVTNKEKQESHNDWLALFGEDPLPLTDSCSVYHIINVKSGERKSNKTSLWSYFSRLVETQPA